MKITKYVLWKANFPIESIAFETILKKNPELKREELNPSHTTDCYVWQKMEYASTTEIITIDGEDNEVLHPFTFEGEAHEMTELSPNHFVVSKDELTEKQAIESAMQHLDTFEGNLQGNHSEEYYVFEKIRG